MFIDAYIFFYSGGTMTSSSSIISNYLERKITLEFYITVFKIKIIQFWHLQCFLQVLFNRILIYF